MYVAGEWGCQNVIITLTRLDDSLAVVIEGSRGNEQSNPKLIRVGWSHREWVNFKEIDQYQGMLLHSYWLSSVMAVINFQKNTWKEGGKGSL